MLINIMYYIIIILIAIILGQSTTIYDLKRELDKYKQKGGE